MIDPTCVEVKAFMADPASTKASRSAVAQAGQPTLERIMLLLLGGVRSLMGMPDSPSIAASVKVWMRSLMVPEGPGETVSRITITHILPGGDLCQVHTSLQGRT